MRNNTIISDVENIGGHEFRALQLILQQHCPCIPHFIYKDGDKEGKENQDDIFV